MAQSSNRAKFLRKLKRKNTLLLRTLKQRHTLWFNAQSSLMAVLGQSGGEFTITQGTYAQTIEAFVKGELSYEAVPGKVKGETVLRLVTREAEQPAEVSPIVPDGDGPDDIVDGPRDGWDAEGEYHHPDTSQSDALLAEAGTPYENIGYNDADADSRTSEEYETTVTGHEYRGPGWDKAPVNAS